MKKKERFKVRKPEQVIQKPIPNWMDKIGLCCGICIILILLCFSFGVINDSPLRQSCYKCNHRFDNFKDIAFMSKEEFGKMTQVEINQNMEEWRRLMVEQMKCEKTHT